MKRRNIFLARRRRPHHPPGSPDTPANEQRQPRPQPESGRRYIRCVHPPQLSDDRWDALGSSQVCALDLIRAGKHDQAVQALRQGGWRNPEEELRKLLIRVQSEMEVPILGKEVTSGLEGGLEPQATDRRPPLRLREAVEQILAANAAARVGRKRSELEVRALALGFRPCWPPGSTGYGPGSSLTR